MKESEKYLNGTVKDLYLDGEYSWDHEDHGIVKAFNKYGDLRVKEAIEELQDKDSLDYINHNLIDDLDMYGNHTSKCVLSFDDSKLALSIQAANFEKKALEAFKKALVYSGVDCIEYFKQQLKSK